MSAVKICGVTSVRDAELCVAAGADAIGLNFHPRSPRYVDAQQARQIVDAVAERALTVGVFVDASYEQIKALEQQTGVACVQLHGDESPELLQALLPHAFKAIRVRDEASIAAARRFSGQHILLDAYEPGLAGGTGRTFRWELAIELAKERQVTLAGGLDPSNVAEAIARVRPFCVDVASGVESAPGRKDPNKVRAFIAAAKGLPMPPE
ncbi:MAG: phosphoribosylanthranilate isomerase [Polyangiales bacterium]